MENLVVWISIFLLFLSAVSPQLNSTTEQLKDALFSPTSKILKRSIAEASNTYTVIDSAKSSFNVGARTYYWHSTSAIYNYQYINDMVMCKFVFIGKKLSPRIERRETSKADNDSPVVEFANGTRIDSVSFGCSKDETCCEADCCVRGQSSPQEEILVRRARSYNSRKNKSGELVIMILIIAVVVFLALICACAKQSNKGNAYEVVQQPLQVQQPSDFQVVQQLLQPSPRGSNRSLNRMEMERNPNAFQPPPPYSPPSHSELSASNQAHAEPSAPPIGFKE